MLSDYNKAKKEGDRAYHRAVMSGEYPYLPALNAMGQNIEKLPERILGVKEIPIDMIVGTKTVGRQNAFANNFMPLVEPDSEFALEFYGSAGEFYLVGDCKKPGNVQRCMRSAFAAASRI